LFKFKQGFDGERNFKGAGHPHQVDPGLGQVMAQFIDHMINESITVDLVVLRGHDGELVVFGIEEARFPWELQRHDE
jgi:hypothetical protein